MFINFNKCATLMHDVNNRGICRSRRKECVKKLLYLLLSFFVNLNPVYKKKIYSFFKKCTLIWKSVLLGRAWWVWAWALDPDCWSDLEQARYVKWQCRCLGHRLIGGSGETIDEEHVAECLWIVINIISRILLRKCLMTRKSQNGTGLSCKIIACHLNVQV